MLLQAYTREGIQVTEDFREKEVTAQYNHNREKKRIKCQKVYFGTFKFKHT